MTTELQAELTFSLKDRKEIDYPRRVTQFGQFIDELSDYFASNCLITSEGDKIRLWPGGPAALIKKASQDPCEPIAQIYCENRTAILRTFKPSFHFYKPTDVEISLHEEKRQATSDDLDRLGKTLNKIIQPETEETFQSPQDDALDAMHEAVLRLDVKWLQKWRKKNSSLIPHRLEQFALLQSIKGIITVEQYHKVSRLLPGFFGEKIDLKKLSQIQSFLVKPHWQPLA